MLLLELSMTKEYAFMVCVPYNGAENKNLTEGDVILTAMKISADVSAARFVVGIDEAGRGPLAGPLGVGAVAMNAIIQHSVLNKLSTGIGIELRDSKKLSARQREAWFLALEEAEGRGELQFRVAFVSAQVIDEGGISAAARLGVARALARLTLSPERSLILLDGLLVAPPRFREQRTLIRGDETEPLIALASIVAKVTRDRKMSTLAVRYPDYGFEKHKGYGTRQHYDQLQKRGVCAIHRRSFCSNIYDGG